MIINKCDYFNIYKNGLADKFTFYKTGHSREENYIYPAEGQNHFYIVVKKSLGLNTKEKFLQWLQQNPVTVVYELEEPVYEEVEYNGIRLLQQNIWEKSTLFFDTNIPSTANISYRVSIPILDQVSEVSSITDDQDALIVDMATQLAVLNMTI